MPRQSMKRDEVAAFYKDLPSYAGKTVTVCGWARSIRDSKALGFIDLNDGTSFKGVQVVFEDGKIENFKEIASQNVGAALRVTGTLLETPRPSSPLRSTPLRLWWRAPLLRNTPCRKNATQWSSCAPLPTCGPAPTVQRGLPGAFRRAFGIHKFFQENGFVYAHTPIITGSDCEGAGRCSR